MFFYIKIKNLFVIKIIQVSSKDIKTLLVLFLMT